MEKSKIRKNLGLWRYETRLTIYDPDNSVTKVLYTTYQYRQFNLSFSLQKMME